MGEAKLLELLRQLGVRRLGVGWGYLIGQLVSWLEENPRPNSTIIDICPLVGNASIPARNYQSNENVRLMAQQMGATPHFLYLEDGFIIRSEQDFAIRIPIDMLKQCPNIIGVCSANTSAKALGGGFFYVCFY